MTNPESKEKGAYMLAKLPLTLVAAAGILFFPLIWGYAKAASKPNFSLHPIGYVKKEGSRTWLVINKAYQDGLLGLEGFSHIYLYFWFDKNDCPSKRGTLRVHPLGNPNNPLTGVFATRSPSRPNLIGMTLSRIVGLNDNILEIDWTDALDKTPIIDIKPFIRAIDCAEPSRVPPWLDNADWVKGSP